MTTHKLYYRILTLLLAVGFAFPAARANTYDGVSTDPSTGIHRIGNYNVRYANDASDVTNGWAWSNRKANLLQLIEDIDFDLLGLEEVTGSTSQGDQMTDIGTALLSYGYSYYPFERDNGVINNGYSYNVLAYKTAKYSVLGNGGFWLSATPDTKGSYGWEYNEYGTTNDSGAAIARTCYWVKLLVKDTSSPDYGTPFVFAMAHANAGKLLDGPESGKLLVSRLSQYADELADAYGLEHGTVPVILVGDFNMDRRRGVNQHAYREYMTYFSDAGLSADSKVTTPNKSTVSACNSLTTTDFTPITSITSDSQGSIFDYVFYRNVHAQSYYIITETYSASKNPSDHYPIYINCTLGHNCPDIYVNANAASGGDGSKASPFTTLTEAKKIATAGSTVHVTADTYNESFELSSPVEFIGGYDTQFENIIGKTEIDGTGKSFAVKAKRNGLYFSNFKISNTVSTGTTESGAFYSTGAEVHLKNCEFYNNSVATTTSVVSGAGLHTVARDVELTDCYFHGNTAPSGSALSIEYIDASISGGDWGAETVRVSGCTFADNSTIDVSGSSTRGAVNVSCGYIGENVNFWNNTFANNTFNGTSGGGSAIYVYSKSNPLINFGFNTIVGNVSTSTGEALIVYRGYLTLINNIIAGNYNAAKADTGTHDAYVNTSVTTVSAARYNVFSTSTSAASALYDSNGTDAYAISINTATVSHYGQMLAALPELLDGAAVDGKFVAGLAMNGGNTPTVKVNATSFDGKDISVLTSSLRALEAAFGVDLNGDGDTSDVINTDQRGSKRLTNSVPGACEFVPLPLSNYFVVLDDEVPSGSTKSGYSWAMAAPESKLPELLATAKAGSTFYLGTGVYKLYSNYEIPEGIAIKGGYTADMRTGRNTDISYDGYLSPDLGDEYKTIFDAQGQNGVDLGKAGQVPFFIIGNPNAASGQYSDYYNGALNTGTKTDVDRVMLQGIVIRNAVNTQTSIDYAGSAMVVTHAIARLANVIIEDCSVGTESGGSKDRGGVISVRGSYFFAADCAWRNNQSTRNGVALNVRQRESKGATDETDRSIVILDRCEFTDNTLYKPSWTSATYGGALVMGDYSGTLYMNNCTATGTHIYSNGAFARIGTAVRFFCTNSTFYDCTATGDLKGIVSVGGSAQTFIANTICVNSSDVSGNNNKAVVYFQSGFTSGGNNVWGSLYNANGSTLADTDLQAYTYTTSAVFGSNTLAVDGGNGLQVIRPLDAYKKVKVSELKALAATWSLPDEVDIARDQRGLYRSGDVTYCGAYDPNATKVRPAHQYFVSVDGNGDGMTWESPLSPKRFAYLLEDAPIGDEYYIMEGEYKPVFTNSASASTTTFHPWLIPEGVTIRGGYPESSTGTETEITYPTNTETIFTADYDGDGVGDNGDLPFFWFDNSDGDKDNYELTTIEGITIRDAYSTCEDRKFYRDPIFLEHVNVEFGWVKILNNTTGYLTKYESDYYQLEPKAGYESKGSSFALPATYTLPVYEVSGAGGAMTVRGSKVYLHDCIWRDNKTTHGGAALCIRQRDGHTLEATTDRSVVKIERNEFTDNILPVQGVTEKEPELDSSGQRTGYYKYHELARYGGAISLADYGGTLYMINCTVSGSHVQYAGGAVRIGTGGVFYSMSNTFFDCTAPTGGGSLLSIGSKTTSSISNTIAVNDAEYETTYGATSPAVRIQSNSTVNKGAYNVFGSFADEANTGVITNNITDDETGVYPYNDIRSSNSMETVFVNNLTEEAALAAEQESELSITFFDNDRYPGYDYLIANERHTAEEGAMDSYVITPKKIYYEKYYQTNFSKSYGDRLIALRAAWDIASEKDGEMDLWRDQRMAERDQNTIVGAYDPYAMEWSGTTESQSIESELSTVMITGIGNDCYRISGAEGTCRVYDLVGHIISTDYVTEGSVINLSGAPSGMYIINVSGHTAKIVK